MLIVVLVMMIIVNGDSDGKMRTVMKMKTRMTSMQWPNGPLAHI